MDDTQAAIPATETPSTPAPATIVPSSAVTPEEVAQMHATIKANFNNLVDITPTKFHFRKVKDEKSGVETKRPTVELPLPIPSVEGIIEILQKGGKGLELLQDAVAEIIIEQAREYVNDNESVTDATFPYASLDWDTIANLPKAERRGGGIAKEIWADFAKDYIAIMPALTGKSVESVELATKVYLTKFSTCKTNKPVLTLLKGQLAIYINNTTQGESFAECVKFLDDKASTLIATDTTNLLAAL